MDVGGYWDDLCHFMRKTLTSSPPTYISSSPLHAAAAIMAPRFANRMNWFYAYDDVVRTMYAPPTLFCTISGENITTHFVMARNHSMSSECHSMSSEYHSYGIQKVNLCH